MSPGQVIVGTLLSTTVMVAGHESDAPLLSTTVSVTLLVPMPNGPAGVSVRLAMVPSGSDEPLSTAEGCTVAVQFALALVVTSRQSATGGWLVLPVPDLKRSLRSVAFAASRNN